MARNTKKAQLVSKFEEKLGFKIPNGWYVSAAAMQEFLKGSTALTKTAKPKKEETDEQVHARILKQFDTLGEIASGTIEGYFRSLIISGPAGLGKSYLVEQALLEYDPNGINTTIVKGTLSPVGLFKQLWDHRLPGQILVLDDSDAIFANDVSLNLLKAACDTTSTRRISYLSESQFVSEKDGSVIEKRFDFEGTVIFITNYDFDDMIERGNRMAPHFEALKSRSMYITLGLKTRRDYMIRVKQIAEMGKLFKDDTAKKEVLSYMDENLKNLDEVSVRMAHKIAGLRMVYRKADWKAKVKETCWRKEGH